MANLVQKYIDIAKEKNAKGKDVPVGKLLAV